MLFDERALTDLTDVQFLISSGIEFHSQVSFDKVVLPRKTDWMGCGTFPSERALVVGPESEPGAGAIECPCFHALNMITLSRTFFTDGMLSFARISERGA